MRLSLFNTNHRFFLVSSYFLLLFVSSFVLFLSQVASGYCGISSGSWCHMRVQVFILQSLQRRGNTSRMLLERQQGWSTLFRCASLKIHFHGLMVYPCCNISDSSMSLCSRSVILSVNAMATVDWIDFSFILKCKLPQDKYIVTTK